MRFLGRWVADCLELTFMLAGALLFMQIPALTHAYVVALQQVAQQARSDIDQREATARQYYHLPPNSADDAVIAALRPVEPSNATALQASLARASMFAATGARITTAPTLRQPIAAMLDAIHQPDPDKLVVLQTSLDTYVPQISFGLAAAIYGIVGLLIGGLLGHSISALPGAAASPRRTRRTV